MRVTAYVIDGHQVDIRPAPVERSWMDATGERFAYRCLPLAIAKAHGWEILCRGGFVARWSGGAALEAIKIFGDPGSVPWAASHFGHGILTFHIPCLFRTEPGVDLFVQGPVTNFGSRLTVWTVLSPRWRTRNDMPAFRSLNAGVSK
jgi:hypothetical protein